MPPHTVRENWATDLAPVVSAVAVSGAPQLGQLRLQLPDAAETLLDRVSQLVLSAADTGWVRTDRARAGQQYTYCTSTVIAPGQAGPHHTRIFALIYLAKMSVSEEL